MCLVAAAFITPGGDPFSLMALAIPLYLLFELSVVLSQMAFRKRRKRQADAERELSGAGAPA